jgi:hypothetical protein
MLTFQYTDMHFSMIPPATDEMGPGMGRQGGGGKQFMPGAGRGQYGRSFRRMGGGERR